MDKVLAEILADNKSGSAELLLKLNQYLSENIRSIPELELLLPVLLRKLSPFAAVANYLSRLKQFSENNDYYGFREFSENLAAGLASAYYTLFRNIFPFIKDKNILLTLSNSRTVFEVLRLLHPHNPHLLIIILESRPAEEGKIMASAMSEAGINVQLITDAQAGHFIQTADAVISGADQILNDGSIVNKTGTNLLAVAAKFYSKPFYVLASKDKFADTSEFIPGMKPPEEIWENKPAEIKVENFYFEKVSGSLITKIFTDQ